MFKAQWSGEHLNFRRKEGTGRWKQLVNQKAM
jgi:hypothetical protein